KQGRGKRAIAPQQVAPAAAKQGADDELNDPGQHLLAPSRTRIILQVPYSIQALAASSPYRNLKHAARAILSQWPQGRPGEPDCNSGPRAAVGVSSARRSPAIRPQ